MRKVHKKILRIMTTIALSTSIVGCGAESTTVNVKNEKKETKTNSNVHQREKESEDKETPVDSLVLETSQDREKQGNTIGNISNQGKLAESNGWIYYVVNGNKDTSGIYRTKDGFQTSEPIVKDVNAAYMA
ncbi:hypothetical protein ACT7C1_35680 [Bacillus paranthracis]